MRHAKFVYQNEGQNEQSVVSASRFRDLYGDDCEPSICTSNYGALYTAKGVAATFAGYLAALVFDRFGSWDLVFYGAAVLTLMAAVGALVLRASPLPKKAYAPETVTATVAR